MMGLHGKRVKVLAMLLFAMGLPLLGVSLGAPTRVPMSGRPMTAEALMPADVLSRVWLLRDEVDLLRREMGCPENLKAEMDVSGAAPREVYFQALILRQRANRLAIEFTGIPDVELDVSFAAEIRPLQVWEVVDSALQKILIIKEHLGIEETVQERSAPVETKPSDVFVSIVQVNRQVDLLLENTFAPRDVYREVSRSIAYAARLLSQYPKVERIPEPPPLERFKRPDDVYHRLRDCFNDVRLLAEAQELDMLRIEGDFLVGEEMSPSDVYDLATLLVSELAYLHAQIPGAERPVSTYDPGRKFPSHVYQRVGILQKQLKLLLERAESVE